MTEQEQADKKKQELADLLAMSAIRNRRKGPGPEDELAMINIKSRQVHKDGK